MEPCSEHLCSLPAGGTVLKGTRRRCQGSWQNLQVLPQGEEGGLYGVTRCVGLYWSVFENSETKIKAQSFQNGLQLVLKACVRYGHYQGLEWSPARVQLPAPEAPPPYKTLPVT